MTMMSLKLNLLEKDLADRFGVSQTTVSRVLNMWIPLLARKMKKLIVMPKAEKVSLCLCCTQYTQFSSIKKSPTLYILCGTLCYRFNIEKHHIFKFLIFLLLIKAI